MGLCCSDPVCPRLQIAVCKSSGCYSPGTRINGIRYRDDHSAMESALSKWAIQPPPVIKIWQRKAARRFQEGLHLQSGRCSFETDLILLPGAPQWIALQYAKLNVTNSTYSRGCIDRSIDRSAMSITVCYLLSSYSSMWFEYCCC